MLRINYHLSRVLILLSNVRLDDSWKVLGGNAKGDTGMVSYAFQSFICDVISLAEREKHVLYFHVEYFLNGLHMHAKLRSGRLLVQWELNHGIQGHDQVFT